MHIAVVRHASTTSSAEGRFQGNREIELADSAHQELASLGTHFAGRKVAALYTSPLSRCVRTAAAITERTGVDARKVDVLREMRLGSFEGLTLAEMAEHFPEAYAAYLEDTATVAPPGGEPFLAMQARVHSFAMALPETDGLTVFVTHTGPILALVCVALALDPRRRVRLKPSPCGITLLSRERGDLRLISFNTMVQP